ncbi:Ig-like domain-containing protein [Corallococcus exercitus]|uniref:adventurous gliding motility protein AgmC n=1 Tax=Corallococcus exercitus TaxID=2316736 RepID=UPI0035D3EE40
MALLCAVFAAPPAFAEPDSFGNGNGLDGPLTVNAAGTVINTYTRLTAPAPAGQSFVDVTDTTGFAVDDLVMIYQSTGFTEAVTSGDPGPFNFQSTPVGNWQFVRLTDVTDTRLTFTGVPLTASFTGGDANEEAIRTSAQAIRVPEYSDVTINAGASLVAKPWSNDADFVDNLGGIVVFFATGTVTNNGTISASGAGFRGGQEFNGEGDNCPATDLDVEHPRGAIKGESLVPARYKPDEVFPAPAGTAGRGNVLHGGGGGVCHNSGGGGGGNGGEGGIGGRTWDGDDDGNAPSRPVGGLGGGRLTFSPANRLLFGGGGGAGHSNDDEGGGGGNAGGIVFIRGQALAGNGSITSDGDPGEDSLNDAAGGGGAGGTISLSFTGALSCGPLGTLSANGGKGGDSHFEEPHGTGGGGGGGNIFLQGTSLSCSTSVAGGVAGLQDTAEAVDGRPYGSAPGNPGVITQNLPPTVSITTPANGSTVTNPNVTVTGTATNATSVVVSFNNTNYPATLTGNTWTVDLPGPLPNGTYTVTAVSSNGTTTSTEASSTFTVAAATTPTVSITTPANGSTVTNPNVTVTGTATNATSVVVSFNNANYPATLTGNTWTVDLPGPLPNGTYTVTAVSSDGTTTSTQASSTFTVAVPQPTPTVSITTPANGSTVTNPNVTVTGSATNATSVTVTFQGTDYPATLTGNTWTVDLPGPLANGTYTVTAVSSNGTATSTEASSTFTVAVPQPTPTVAITTPANGSTVTNPNVTVTGSATNATSVTVTFQGTDYPATLTGNTWTVDLPGPLADGTYTVTAVSSNGTTNSTTATSTFTVNPASTVDTDNDGLTDEEEVDLGTNPNDPDSDDDGIPDGIEVKVGGTDPLDDDSDDDGIIDGNEDADHDGIVDADETDPKDIDTDDDGLTDGVETGVTEPQGDDTDPSKFVADKDPATTTNPLDDDTDDDGLLDGNEDANHDGLKDPTETDPNDIDTDDDGLTDGLELGLTQPQGEDTDPTKFVADQDPDTKTNPLNPDTDGGSVLDGIEDRNHNGRVDVLEPDPNNAADDKDADGDGIDNATELEKGTDPFDPDTDDDGVPDGIDGLTDTDGDGTVDALDPDSDNDGILDGTELGVTVETAPPGTDTSSPNFKPDADPTTKTDPKKADTDGDGLKDGEEDANHDGRRATTETDPTMKDTDQGGIDDGTEVNGGSDPLDANDDYLVVGHGCSTGGSGSLAPFALMLMALPLVGRRFRRAGNLLARAGGALAVFVTALFAGTSAHAQATAVSQAIDVQQYKPGPGIADVLAVHGAKVQRHLGWNVGLSVNYADKPLNFFDPRSDTYITSVVKSQVGVDLMGAIGIYDRFEIGVVLPITIQSSENSPGVDASFANGVSGGGIGDLRLIPKARLLDGDNYGLSVVVPVSLPTGGASDFLGGSGVSVNPRVVAEYGRRFRVLANVGVDIRKAEQLRNLNVGSALAYGVGAEAPLGDLPLAVQASLVGAVGFKQQNEEERPLELLAALKYRGLTGLSAQVGAGPGLTHGYGTPTFRVLASVGYSTPERAPAQPRPVCPEGPEDFDGFQDQDGCADPDNDGDGIVDTADKCPNEPETVNAFEDADGCPDTKPAPPPPPVDTDGDGLMDPDDKCPNAPEDKDGFQDEDGCPDPDNDKDGIVDTADKCPLEPETINGVADEDGCPDKGKVKVLVEGERILILEKVYFATNKDVILPRSFPILKQVAAVLRANPHVELLRVEGHTDSQGSDVANLDLSKRRAASVKTFLVNEGIAAERLESEGFGESKPVDTNKTAAGRENNRRVEFNITRMGKVEVEKPAP